MAEIIVNKEELQEVFKETLSNAKTEIEKDLKTSILSEVDRTISGKTDAAIIELKKTLPPTQEPKIEVKAMKNPIGKWFHIFGKSVVDKKTLEEAAADFGMNIADFGVDVKTLNPSTIAGGGGFIPSTIAPELVDMLRNESVVLKAMPRTVPVPNGNMSWNVLETGSTFAWRNLTGNKVTTAPTFKQINIVVTSFAGRVPIPNAQLRYANPMFARELEKIIIEDMASQLDATILISGNGEQNTPNSLVSLCPSTQTSAVTGGGSVTATTIGTDLLTIRKYLMKNNIKMINPVWFMTPAVKASIAEKRDGSAMLMDYAAELNNTGKLKGYEVFTTNALNTSATQSTILLVDMSYMIFAVGQPVSVRLDTNGAYVLDGNHVSGQITDHSVFDVSTECNFYATHNKAIGKLTACTWDA